MKTPFSLVLSLTVSLTIGSAAADFDSPAGRWKTIDDDTGKAKSIVVIQMENGRLAGRIEALLNSPKDHEPRICERCEGELKDAPLLGLRFMWGFRPQSDEWIDGQILDPNNGKIYSSKLRLTDGGRRLDVRGYVGLPLFGRSQIWERVE